jgi:voltage-gated potassium channel
MFALSVVFLCVLVVPVLDETLSPGWRDAFGLADIAIWVAFAADYLIRLALVQQRGRFVLHNIPDLIVIMVPVLRTLRLVRLAQLLRFARSGALAVRTTQRARSRLHVNAAIQISATAVIVMFVGAIGMLDVERHVDGANIRTFGDAAWWALSTVTTVGYGDRYPVTSEGRLIAAAVMLTGVAVLGVVTASIASWFVENLQNSRRTETEQSGREQRIEAALTEALDRLNRIEERLGRDRQP